MKTLELYFRIVSKEDAASFLKWQYTEPYQVYNYDPKRFEEDLAYHINPKNNLYSIYLDGELAGYCSFGHDAQVPGGDYSLEAMDIGLMIKPEITGQGQGGKFAADVIQYGIALNKPKTLRVTIADFNKRAMRVWEKQGFERIQEFERTHDKSKFVILTRQAEV
ncbi:MAG: GNAT family N-acetyltransferase [Anaerolineaceae bacterium]|nr:GNAT family N-acetyltransferase [Anaerolineaceae bacterium]